VLNLLRGLVGSGDEVIATITSAVDKPESIRSIRNFLLLTQFFAGIPPDVLKSLVETVRAGAQREKSQGAPRVTEFVQALPQREQQARHGCRAGSS
jgi:hypothetical protein